MFSVNTLSLLNNIERRGTSSPHRELGYIVSSSHFVFMGPTSRQRRNQTINYQLIMTNYPTSFPKNSCYLEEPRIRYVSRKAKGVYANLLLDEWFKRAFCELPFSERLLLLFLQEVIPERKIASIKYAPQEHTNPNPDKRGIRVDVEATDADGARFLVEMQREPQNCFYERALYNSSHCIIRQMERLFKDFLK